MHCNALQKLRREIMLSPNDRQRDGSNMIHWHYFTDHKTGDFLGLRGYSNHRETDRYEVRPHADGFKCVYCWWHNLTGTPGLDEPGYRTIKTGNLPECLEAAEVYDEQIGESLMAERERD
jgi:hypothetical protein